MRVAVADGWWPKLNDPYLICGSQTCALVDVRDGRVLVTHPGPGLFPVGWLSDGRYVVSREPGGDANHLRQVALVHPALNALDWSEPFAVGSPLVVFNDALVYGDNSDAHYGVWRGSLDGQRWERVAAYRALGASMRVQNGRLAVHLHPGYPADTPEAYQWAVFDAAWRVTRLPSDHLVIPGPADWHGIGYYGPARIVRGGPTAQFRDLSVTPDKRESVPVLFPVLGEEWCATATADDVSGQASVLLRPVGDTQVIQLRDFPAAWIDVAARSPLDAGTGAETDLVLVAGNDTAGRLTLAHVAVKSTPRAPFDPGDPMFPPLPVDDPTERRITGPVDVKPYLVGDESDWPAAAEGDGVMHCFWEPWGTTGDGRAFFQKDVAAGRHWEVWEIHAEWVRHRRDHVGDARGEYYEFSDGRWLPRRVTPAMIGQTVVTALDNRIRWGFADGRVSGWTPFPYAMRIQICTEARLVFHYDPAPGSGNHEVYECLRNRGWRRWWLVDDATGRVVQASQWMSNADPSRRTRPVGAIPDPRVPRDTPGPDPTLARATIITPTFPVTGPAPLAVRCVAEITDGASAAKGFVWQVRKAGDATWWSEHGVPVPPHDTDHTYRFPTPGEYEIRLVTHSLNGQTDATARLRRVIVTAPAPAPPPVEPPPVEPPPVEPPPVEPPTDWRPTRAAVRVWSGDFLDARHGFARPTFMLPGMPEAEQDEVLAAYPGTHVPFGWKTTYPRFPQWGFDFSEDFAPFEATMDRCFRRERIPVCMIPVEAGDSIDQHLRRIAPLLQRLIAGTRLVALGWGWEINDINDWTCDGDAQLDYLNGLRALVGHEIPIYAHWTPERWSGWPSYRNTIGRAEDEGGEGDWLRRAKTMADLTGVLYQEPWDKPLDATFERTYEYDKKNYQGPGICGRILTYALDFVFFEHSREAERYRQVVDYARRDGRGGWC